MKVSKVMSKAVVIDDTITLRQAAKIMSRKNIANVIIIKKGNIEGYVSERDVLLNLNNLDKSVSISMSKKVITIDENASIFEAGNIMVSKKLKRLPVVRDGKIVGAISFRDVIRYIKSSSQSDGNEGDFFFN